MPFRFFTRRGAEPSLRLRIVARGLQLYGGLGLVSLAMLSMSVFGSSVLRERFMSFLPQMLIFGVLRGTAQLMAGRALLRRLRWGAVAAGATFATPLLLRLFGTPIPSAWLIESSVGVLLTASLWRELTTYPDPEAADTEAEALPLSTLRTGFGVHTRRLAEAERVHATMAVSALNGQRALEAALVTIAPSDSGNERPGQR